MTQTLAEIASLPFEPQVSPEQALRHNGWRQARGAVLTALAEGRLAVLVGESGAGKTLMLRELERTLRDAGVMARRYGPDSAAEPVTPNIVRLVDDADALDHESLLRIAQRSKAAVLAVAPDSLDRVMSLPRPVAPTRLAPLSPAEVHAFVASALAAAGRPLDLFSAEALAALACLSKGLPGRVNLLGQAALLHAQLEEASHVQPEHVSRAAESLQPGTAVPSTHPAPRRMAAASARAEGIGGSMAMDVREPAGQAWRRPLLITASVLVLGLAIAGWLLTEPQPPPAPGDLHPTGAVRGSASSTPPWVAQRRPPRSPDGVSPAGSLDHMAEMAPRASAEPRPATGVERAPAAPPAAPPLPRPPPTSMGGGAAQNVAPAAPPNGVPAPPRTQAPEPARVTGVASVGTFRGSTFNETLGRAGGLQLVVTRVGQGEAVVVLFEAFRGLIGTGELAGRLSADGRLFASGTLMMGQNPFTAELDGTIVADQLVGTVRYTRVVEPGGRVSNSRGRFRLSRD